MDIADAMPTWNLWRCTRQGARGSRFALSELSRNGLVQVATIKDVQDRSPRGTGNKLQALAAARERTTENRRPTTDDRRKTRSSGVSRPSFSRVLLERAPAVVERAGRRCRLSAIEHAGAA
jgi:hypothetical protein